MSQTDLEKFFDVSVKMQRGPDGILKGAIDGREFTGDTLIAAAITKGKELGYEFTNEEVAKWIARQRETGTGGALSESDLDDIAEAFRERDQWLGDKG